MNPEALATLNEHLLTALAAAPAETRRLFHGRGRCWPGLEQVTVDWLQGVVLVALGAWYLMKPSTVKVAAPTAIPVRVVNVVEKDVPRYVTGIGSVLSLHSVVVRPQIDGILTRILVKEGQLVSKGDLLATIDDRSIRAATGRKPGATASGPGQPQALQAIER